MRWLQRLGGLAMLSGCYLSHHAETVPDAGRVVDAPLAERDAPGAGACVFSLEHSVVGEVVCRIDPGVDAPCNEAALCICGAWNPDGTTAEIAECLRWEIEPRGDITFADFCADVAPARATMEEALDGYLRARRTELVSTSEGCRTMPALARW